MTRIAVNQMPSRLRGARVSHLCSVRGTRAQHITSPGHVHAAHPPHAFTPHCCTSLHKPTPHCRTSFYTILQVPIALFDLDCRDVVLTSPHVHPHNLRIRTTCPMQ
eukprot:265161-Chlamydomonas_euryale.AAC.1